MDERFQELVLFYFLKVPNPRIRIVLTIQAKNVHENLLKKNANSYAYFIHTISIKVGGFIVLSLLFSPAPFHLSGLALPDGSVRFSWRPVLRIPGRRWNFP